MDDSDSGSIASTIHTDHDSEEEWQVSDIIAAWEVDGSQRYLVKWEGFDLFEATWEPKEHLNDELISGWEKVEAEGDFDVIQIIREWKNAWKQQYAERLARHQERNRRRRKQGLKTTPFTYMDDCLAWVNRFPDGDELSGSTVSSPSGTVLDLDTDTGIEQQSQSLPAKRKLSTASLSEDSSPKLSAQNNTTNTHKKTPAQTSLNATSISHKQASQKQSSSVSKPKSAPTSSLLFSKFSKSTKRTDQRKSQLTARKTQPAQAFTGNVFVGGKERKKRATLAERAADPSKTPKLIRHRYARIIEKAGRDRECAAPIRMPSDLISLNPADQPTSNSNILSSEAMKNGGHPSSDGDKRAPQDESPEDKPPPKAKLKKSISWGTVEETIISTLEEEIVFDREASLFIRENSVADTDTASTIKAEVSLAGEPTPSLAQASSRPVTWTETTPAPAIQRGKSPLSRTIATDIQFGPGTRETISVDFERHQPQSQNETPWPDLFENEPILIFTHTCITRDFEGQEKTLVADQLGTGSIASDSNSTGLDLVANWLRSLLITPSFVVSQPQQAWTFFKWFYKDWHHDRDSVRLAVCADFDTWILGLATEYEDDGVRHKRKSFARKIDSGIAEKEHEALYKIWGMVRGLMESSSEEQPAFIFAPDSFDGNDEQSLVNWFGWWSIVNLDMYRKFNVVGSNNKAPERLTRRIPRPEFSPSTLTSPDEAYGVIDPNDSFQTPLQTIPTVDPVRSPPRRKFRMIIGDDAASFRKVLNEIESSAHKGNWTPVTLFNVPVAHWDPGMADAGFAPYSQCVWHFGETVHGPGPHNTSMALCYTPEGTWITDETRENHERSRQPWIVVYRAIELFKKPWTGTELVIWDPTWGANARWPGEIYEGDLIEAQRRLIQAVREKLDTEMELKKIWIGGPDLYPDGLTEPLDVTIDQLRRIMLDVKSGIPAPRWALINSGWRIVEPGDRSPKSPLSSSESMDIDSSSEPMDVDSPIDTGRVADDGLKSIFHPPRGKQMDRPSNCKNRLLQHCSNDKARGNKGRYTEYRFRPTMEWYEQQVEEGRGFEHIRVTAWEAVFERYRIDSREKDRHDGDKLPGHVDGKE
ncbi:hypothetical protein ACHAPA_003781 [Fusarium lateritium]